MPAPLEKYDQVASLKTAYAGMYEIGEGSYGGLNIFSYDEKTKIEIGSYCSFAFGVTAILGGNHRHDWTTTYPFSDMWPEAQKISGHPSSNGNVKIGSDVWVGAEAMIMSGVTIGDGAVVAARTVVTRDVLPYQIVGGAPGKPIDWRFDTETIARLMAIKWWNWPKERILRAIPLMLSPKVDYFLEAAEKGHL